MSSAVAQWEVQRSEDNLLGRVSPARATPSPRAVLPSLESNSGVAIEEVEEQEESEEIQGPIPISGGLAPLPAGSVMLSTPDRSSALHGLAEAAAGAPTDPNEIPSMSQAFRPLTTSPEISERVGKRTAEDAGLDDGTDVDRILSTRG